MTARGRPTTRSPTGTTLADSGAVVVLDAKDGSVVAMASQPTYDPSVWVDGITSKQLKALYSKKSGNPLLVPGDAGPVRPGLDVEADHDRRRAQQRLLRRTPGSTARAACRSATGWFKNYESAAYGMIDFARALELSCDTFFYRVGLSFWNRVRLRPDQRQRQGPAGRAGEGLRLRAEDRHRHPR